MRHLLVAILVGGLASPAAASDLSEQAQALMRQALEDAALLPAKPAHLVERPRTEARPSDEHANTRGQQTAADRANEGAAARTEALNRAQNEVDGNGNGSNKSRGAEQSRAAAAKGNANAAHGKPNPPKP